MKKGGGKSMEEKNWSPTRKRENKNLGRKSRADRSITRPGGFGGVGKKKIMEKSTQTHSNFDSRGGASRGGCSP